MFVVYTDRLKRQIKEHSSGAENRCLKALRIKQEHGRKHRGTVLTNLLSNLKCFIESGNVYK